MASGTDVSPQTSPWFQPARLARSLATAAWHGMATPRGARVLIWGAVAMLPLVTAIVWQTFQHREEFTYTMEDALRLLDAGAFGKARYIANRLIATGAVPETQRGGPLFVQGVSTILEAEGLWEDDRRRRNLEGAAYLKLAREYGFPAGREADGLLHLGRALYVGGLHAEGRQVLREALAFDSATSNPILALLAQSYLEDAQPDFELALQFNTQYLVHEGRTNAERQEGLLLRGRILMALDRAAECRAVLDQLDPSVRSQPAARILAAQLAIHETADPGVLEGVIADLASLQRADPPLSATNARSRYWIGRCLRRQGKTAAALEHLAATAHDFASFPEGIVAALEAAELALESQDFARCVALLEGSLRGAPAAHRFSNPCITLEQYRARLLDAIHHLIAARAYQQAIEVAEGLDRVFPKVVGLEQTALAYRLWAEQPPESGDSLLAEQAHAPDNAELWRRAGETFAALAQMRFTTDHFLEDAWQSAEAFRHAGVAQESLRMYSWYLEYDARGQRPQALMRLGEALLASGRAESALVAIDQFMAEYPRHVAVYEARLTAGQALEELGKLAEASVRFLENLEDPQLQPESPEWRKSLLALGRVLYAEGVEAYATAMGIPRTAPLERLDALDKCSTKLEQVVRRLREFCHRYKQNAAAAMDVTTAHYLLADSYWKLARYPKERSEAAAVESTRLRLRREVRQLLHQSAEAYDIVQRRLNAVMDDQRAVSPELQFMLRNCYFARGAILFELGDYAQAAQAYAAAANRYQSAAEALEALMQLAACYRHLGRGAEAMAALEQARVLLSSWPEDVRCENTTNFTRDEWLTEIEWLRRRYQDATLAAAGPRQGG